MNKNAIIDTSVIISLHHLGLLNTLNLLFNKVYVPRAVEKEFLEKHPNPRIQTERFTFLQLFYLQNSIWFKSCQAYRSDIIEIYKTEKKLDEGEIEVLAQNQELGGNNILLLDEKEARKIADFHEFKKNGVLFILATLDLKLKLCNYFESVDLLRSEINTRFSDSIIKMVYNHCKNENV